MKRKGFTLVELLVVIVALGLIATITAVVIGKAGGKATNAISAQEKKNIEDAAKLLAIDMDENYGCFAWMQENDNSCLYGGTYVANAKVTISSLISHNYLSDTSNHCSGYVTITGTPTSYTVDTSKVSCNSN